MFFRENVLPFLVVFIILFCDQAKSQNFCFLDARSKSLSGISSTLTNSAYVFLQNPANLALFRRPIFSINVNQLFEYDQAAVTDYIPRIGGVGLAIGQSYNNDQVDYASIGWGRTINNSFNVGVSGVFYRKNDMISPEWQFGLSYYPSSIFNENYNELSQLDRFGFAAVLQNTSFQSKKYGPPVQFNLGVRYRTTIEILEIFAESQFRKNNSAFILASELHTSSYITFRSGFSNFDANHFLFGMGVHLNNFNLNFVYERYLEQIQFSCTIQFGDSPFNKARDFFEKGRLQLNQNNIENALNDFYKAIIYNPENESYQQMYSNVKSTYDQLLAEANQKVLEAQEYENNGQILAALVRYLDISEQYPKNDFAKNKIVLLKPVALYQMVEVKREAIKTYEDGDYVNAKKIFNVLNKVNPQDITIKKYKLLTDKAIQEQAEDRFYRGLGYFSQKNFKNAKREFDIVFRLKPDFPEIDIYLNDVQNNINSNQKAIDSLLVIANENRNSKDFKKLIDIYNSILDRDPSNQEAFDAKEEILPKAATYISDIFSRAQTEFRKKNYIRTEFLCSEMLRIEPDDEKAKGLLIRSRQSRLDYAQELWQQGDEVLKNKKYNNAKDLFLKAIQNNSSKAQYVQSLRLAEEKLAAQIKYQTANELLNDSQFNQAEKIISELLEKYPDEKQYLDLLYTFQQRKSLVVTSLLQGGIRLYSQNKLEDALKKFDKLLEIDKENQIGNDYKIRIQEKILALKK